MCFDSLDTTHKNDGHRFKDFDLTSEPGKVAEALILAAPGTCVSFVLRPNPSSTDLWCHRHFGIYLGPAWIVNKDNQTRQLDQLVSHYYNNQLTLSSFHQLAERSTEIRVYKCDCSDEDKEARIIKCLHQYGSSPGGGTCLTMIRQALTPNPSGHPADTFGKKLSKFPPKFISESIFGVLLSAAFYRWYGSIIEAEAVEPACDVLVKPTDPLVRLGQSCRLLGLMVSPSKILEISPNQHIKDGYMRSGLAVFESHRCTRDFTSDELVSCQELHECEACQIDVCKHCAETCHAKCPTRIRIEDIKLTGFCDCPHGCLAEREYNSDRNRS